jgi:tRNA (pseudouridine54-N1)-methyltransferase
MRRGDPVREQKPSYLSGRRTEQPIDVGPPARGRVVFIAEDLPLDTVADDVFRLAPESDRVVRDGKILEATDVNGPHGASSGRSRAAHPLTALERLCDLDAGFEFDVSARGVVVDTHVLSKRSDGRTAKMTIDAVDQARDCRSDGPPADALSDRSEGGRIDFDDANDVAHRRQASAPHAQTRRRGGVRRFVVIGRKAAASDDFSLDDLAGSSGRIDVLLRCVRASLLHSHGLRRDVAVYLVLGGGPRAPRVLRFDGATAKYIRPDERSLATLAKKALGSGSDRATAGFVEVKPGIAVANGGLEVVLPDLAGAMPFVLEENAPDIRDCPELDQPDVAFFVGDHLGLDEATRTRLLSIGARRIAVGPTSIHADDAIAVVANEVDRRQAARCGRGSPTEGGAWPRGSD